MTKTVVSDTLLSTADIPPDAFKVLSERLTPVRKSRMEAVASQRTDYLRLVIQDIHDPHNVSAALRSADAFGIQHNHVVTLREKFHPSTVARGVNHWLTIHTSDTVAACAADLKAQGYRIAAALPKQDSVPMAELPLDRPLAVVFGNEHAGVDPAWGDHVDVNFTIPMVGMVESLNISVSVAITLQHLRARMLSSTATANRLVSSDRATELLNFWICSQTTKWQEEYERRKK